MPFLDCDAWYIQTIFKEHQAAREIVSFIEKNCSVKGQAKEKGIENLLADCIGMVQVWVEAELLCPEYDPGLHER